MSEVRFKMAQLLCQFENKQISTKEMNTLKKEINKEYRALKKEFTDKYGTVRLRLPIWR